MKLNFQTYVIGTTFLLLALILIFPVPFYKISMMKAIHLVEGSFNQRYDNVTHFQINYIRFENPGSFHTVDKKVWILGVLGKGYQDDQLCGEAITYFVDPNTGQIDTGARIGFQFSETQQLSEQDSGANKTVLILDSEIEGAHARKSSFARGEIVAFNFESIFPQPDSYIKIYDPNGTLYWRTEAFVDSWWLNGGLYAVPYNRQTAGGNPMRLATDAPLGIWSWEWYDNFDDKLDSGMFTVAGTLLVNETISDAEFERARELLTAPSTCWIEASLITASQM